MYLLMIIVNPPPRMTIDDWQICLIVFSEYENLIQLATQQAAHVTIPSLISVFRHLLTPYFRSKKDKL